MEMILDEKDASDWIYRGEGAANIVLSYTGSSPAFIGKVLRIQKSPKTAVKSTTATSILSTHEILLWKDVKDIASATSKDVAGQLFVRNVMVPLLSFQHVDAGMHVLVSRGFLEVVENNILCQRPAWRVDAAKVNTLCDSALLISDHSIFPHGSIKEEPCISVEIKPKCGFLPCSRFIADHNAIKRSITRFQMHQILKFHQGEAFFIDLDMKPLKKMVYYNELDQKILRCYSETKKIENGQSES